MSLADYERVTTPELAVDVPNGWEDCSVTRYLFPERGASLRLSTVPSSDHDVRYHAFALQDRMHRNAPHFRIASRRFFRMGDEDAFELVFDWKNDLTPCRNFVRIVVHAGVLSVLTATAPLAALDEVEPAIARAMSSFALAR